MNLVIQTKPKWVAPIIDSLFQHYLCDGATSSESEIYIEINPSDLSKVKSITFRHDKKANIFEEL